MFKGPRLHIPEYEEHKWIQVTKRRTECREMGTDLEGVRRRNGAEYDKNKFHESLKGLIKH